MFRITGERHSESHEKSKHFRIRVGEFGVTVQECLDLKDAVSNRPVLGKTAYRERVRRALKSQEARTVAKICALGLRKVCKRVVESGGIATRG